MAIVLTVAAYLIGSISFAVLVSRAMGLPDPRTFGSKNPGATNVLRTGRKAAAALTLLGDSAKGWLAVFLTDILFATAVPPVYKMSLVAVAVVVGHMYPVFYRFQGGKGVSTALGVLLALNGWLAAGAAATWIIIAFFFRISSLAALVAAVSAPFFCFLLYGVHPYTAAVGVIALLLIWRHKTNIRNLLAGTEGRIDEQRQKSDSLPLDGGGAPERGAGTRLRDATVKAHNSTRISGALHPAAGSHPSAGRRNPVPPSAGAGWG